MERLINVVQAIHIVNAVLLAWPFYALVAVNQRARLGPPLGDRADTYMENIIKNRTVPCFVFQATALVSGIALILLRGAGLGALVTIPVLGVKFLLLLLLGALLTYVHTSLQPRIDALFAIGADGGVRLGYAPIAADVAREIGALRLRRKRIASLCMFVVLTIAMLGVQVWSPFSPWLTIVLVIAIGVFTWRAYGSATRYGWI